MRFVKLFTVSTEIVLLPQFKYVRFVNLPISSTDILLIPQSNVHREVNPPTASSFNPQPLQMSEFRPVNGATFRKSRIFVLQSIRTILVILTYILYVPGSL